MKATFIRQQPENPARSIITFWFQPEARLDQIAGQFVEITLSHNSPDERGHKRWYTLSNSPTDTPLISITTNLDKNGSSFKQTLSQLRPGDQIIISEPMGDFVLPKDASIPLIFIAGGIGITPYHSIIKFLNDTGQNRNINLFYSVRTPRDLIYKEILESANLSPTIICQKPDSSWQGETGYLSGQRIMDKAQPSPGSLFYISGPKSLVETIEKDLIRLGVNRTYLVTDAFSGL
jgi:ferredoxin-NADP reductase